MILIKIGLIIIITANTTITVKIQKIHENMFSYIFNKLNVIYI